jgi:hypothetical protein
MVDPQPGEFLHVFNCSRFTAMAMEVELLTCVVGLLPTRTVSGMTGYELPHFLFRDATREATNNVFATVTNARNCLQQLRSVKSGWRLLLTTSVRKPMHGELRPLENIEAIVTNRLSSLDRLCETMALRHGSREEFLGNGRNTVKKLRREAREAGLRV